MATLSIQKRQSRFELFDFRVQSAYELVPKVRTSYALSSCNTWQLWTAEAKVSTICRLYLKAFNRGYCWYSS